MTRLLNLAVAFSRRRAQASVAPVRGCLEASSENWVDPIPVEPPKSVMMFRQLGRSLQR